MQRKQLAAALEPPPTPPPADGPRCTLIVCPLSVMSNWVTQFEEHTAGNLQVGAAAGRGRGRNWALLCCIVAALMAELVCQHANV